MLYIKQDNDTAQKIAEVTTTVDLRVLRNEKLQLKEARARLAVRIAEINAEIQELINIGIGNQADLT